MSKEYLEVLERIKKSHYTAIAVMGCERDYETEKSIEIVETALHRLESIDNANPSEALECLEYIENKLKDLEYIAKQNDNEYLLSKYIPSEKFNTIKQALIKSQEPKQYLKWEDLEFKEDNEAKIKVRMGEHIYDLWYGSYKTGYGTFKQKCSLDGYDFDEDYDIDIFNDLHLERVEE